MTAQEFRDTIAALSGLTKRQVDEYFNVLADVMADALARGDRVDLMKFGSVRMKNYSRWKENIAPPAFACTTGKTFRELVALFEEQPSIVVPATDADDEPEEDAVEEES